MGLIDWLSERGHGDVEDGDYHYPEYTHGCWGGCREPLCWLCKFRYIGALARLARRTK